MVDFPSRRNLCRQQNTVRTTGKITGWGRERRLRGWVGIIEERTAATQSEEVVLVSDNSQS
jgi:hypothetical protein